MSEIYDQEEGVPQGSILVVTVFITINSIVKCLNSVCWSLTSLCHSNGHIEMGNMDDFLLCYQSKHINTTEGNEMMVF